MIKTSNAEKLKSSTERYDIRTIRFTPELATEYLKKQFNTNRPIRIQKLNAYKRAMINGDWKNFTGEFILLTPEGKLINGQHRLRAVIETKTLVEMDVIFNIPEDRIPYLDQGASRTRGDQLHIQGINNGASIAGYITKYSLFEKNNATSMNPGNKGLYEATSSECLRIYKERPDFWQDVHKNVIAWFRTCLSGIIDKSTIGGIYAHLYDTFPEESQAFFDELSLISPCTNASVKAIQAKLLEDRTRRASKKDGMTPNTRFEWIKTAWYNYLRDLEPQKPRLKEKLSI